MPDVLVTFNLADVNDMPYDSGNIVARSTVEVDTDDYRVLTDPKRFPLTNSPLASAPFPAGAVIHFTQPDGSGYFKLIPDADADYTELETVVPVVEPPGYLTDEVVYGALSNPDSESRAYIDTLLAGTDAGNISDPLVGALVNNGTATKDALGDEIADPTSPAGQAVADKIATATEDLPTVSEVVRAGNESAVLLAATTGDSTTIGGGRATNDTVIANGNTWPAIGGGGIQKAGAQSWFTWMCLLSGGRIVAHYNAAVAQSLVQRNVDDFPALLASGANIVFVGDAHNDLNATSPVVPEADTRADILWEIDEILAAGKIPVCRTIYPDLTTAPLGAAIRRHNAWLRTVARTRNLYLVDTYRAVTDPATGGWKAGFSLDGVHPTTAAAQVAGAAALADMAGLLRGAPASPVWLPTDNVQGSGQLLANPLFLTDANNDQSAEPWSATSSGTQRTLTDVATTNGSVTLTSASGAFTDDDMGRAVAGTGIPANAVITEITSSTAVKMQVSATATNTGVTVTLGNVGRKLLTDPAVLGKAMRVLVSGGTTAFQQGINVDGTTLSIGDRLKWVGKAKLEGATAGTLTPLLNFTCLSPTPAYVTSPLIYATGIDQDWFYFECDLVVQTGTTLVRVGINTNAGTGKVYLAQNAVWNLTKLG